MTQIIPLIFCNTQKKHAIPEFDVCQSVKMILIENEHEHQLHCSCNYVKEYGILCSHSLVVAKSFAPTWTGMTHNDISMLWWKAYFKYSLPEKVIPDQYKQQKIKQIFHTL